MTVFEETHARLSKMQDELYPLIKHDSAIYMAEQRMRLRVAYEQILMVIEWLEKEVHK